MRRVLVATLVLVAGCHTPAPFQAANHSKEHRELPPAPAVVFTPKPVGAKPTAAQIKEECERFVWANAPACDRAKAVEYAGEAGAPPAVHDAEPGIYQGSLPVYVDHRAYAGPTYSVIEQQPTHEVRAWINVGHGYQLHKLHYLDAKLVAFE